MRRVLLTTYPTAFLHHGGGEREILLINEALNAAGIMANIYGPTSRSLDVYQDVIHFSLAEGTGQMIDAMAHGDRRFILWPNLWFVDTPSAAYVAHLQYLLGHFQVIVFKSNTEEVHFREYFDISGLEVMRVSPLISNKFGQRNVSTVFKESYGLSEYAIWTGIIEPQKNQLAAVRAFRDSEIPLVVSGEVRDRTYFEQCRAEAGENTFFIPAMSFGSELHLSALAHCSLYVELPLDFPGTSALEAATMGCRLLLSKSMWTQEMLGGRCMEVGVHDVDDIHAMAMMAMASEQPTRFGKHLKQTEVALSSIIEYLK